MSESVLTMNQVEKRYRNVPVLQDITMEIPRGSIYGLVGSNGAGKSTLMRLISGQTRIDRGEMRLFGKIPEKKEQRVRRRIGTLIEEPGFTVIFRPGRIWNITVSSSGYRKRKPYPGCWIWWGLEIRGKRNTGIFPWE